MERLVKVFLTVFAAVVVANLFTRFIDYKLDNLKNNPVKLAEMADAAEVFIPYLQLPSGKTVYESFNDSGTKALGFDND